MSFKITARTILQLGSELISSDAIAFYELIKNAFDAGSKRVDVRIVKRLPQEIIRKNIAELEEVQLDKKASIEKINETILKVKDDIILNILPETYLVNSFKQRISGITKISDLVLAIKKANYILIKDFGEGMSIDDLENIYLTIGTRNRRKQKDIENSSGRPILGEKGLGRLSVMRLGESLKVKTTKSNDSNYNILEIDWTLFSNDSDALLESIDVKPYIGDKKDDSSEEGTEIYIFDLHESWDIFKIREICRSQLSRFVDPFERANRDFIRLWFNTEAVVLENLNKQLFEHSHAIIQAKLDFDEKGNAILSGEINYKLYDRKTTFKLSGIHLLSILGNTEDNEILNRLGPFETRMYWFNRLLITKKNGVEDPDNIKGLVDNWGGGLMVYRDGFRVNPYGGPSDDWLGLDPKALKSGGYKLNRKQFVGKVDISTYKNPALQDQTNREGLRDSSEKKALIALLQYIIWTEVKGFFEAVKEDYEKNTAVVDLDEIEKRINLGQDKVRSAVRQLKQKFPAIQYETEILDTIEGVLKESSSLFKSAKNSSIELESRLKTTLDLAGLGLMVDVIAHELNRSTDHALKTVNSIAQDLPEGISSSINVLRSQLKTLQARLKILDPLGPSGRQVKTPTDLKKLIHETLSTHESQFLRHKIKYKIVDDSSIEDWNVKVVPGMLIQILENLISNSVYWIKQKQILETDYKPEIIVQVNRKNNSILYSDNGPGIPSDRREDIFRPFFSTKPPGVGKGLGLYISQEIAKYNKATLTLKADSSKDFLNTFILSLQ